MAVEYTFQCPLPNGLHARPASQLAAVAGRFACELQLNNERTGTVANAKSILAIVSAHIRFADACVIRAAGADEAAALAALRDFVERMLPEGDEPLPVARTGPGEPRLPRALRTAGTSWLAGTPVSGGIGQGIVVVIGGLRLPEALVSAPTGSPQEEQRKLTAALTSARTALERRLTPGLGMVEAGILHAHLAMVADVALQEKLDEFVAAGRSAGAAVVEAGRFFADRLGQAESALVRERAADVQDVCLQLLHELYGTGARDGGPTLTQPSVVVAENLSPHQLLALDRRLLRGLVLGYAGTTSHTVVLARSFDVPTLVGVADAARRLTVGNEIIVDAHHGIVVAEVTPAARRFYAREERTRRARAEQLARFTQVPALTRDGRRLQIAANVATIEELAPAFAGGAEGVGLFRTEMLFLDRDRPPSEEEQFGVYVQAAKTAAGRPVIIRTLDIGGDKPAAYLNLRPEANPFLGQRGVRLYPEQARLFNEQTRAILRASAFGPLWVMVPMIATLDEVRWVKARLAEVQADLAARGVAFNRKMPMGIMLEVPSIAFILEPLCREVDFFSIGTNDLTQYFLAVDRGNENVADLYRARHPALLKLLDMVVRGIHDSGRWVGLCGEMGRDRRSLPLLVGLGLDEISVAAADVPGLKAAVGQLDAAECRRLFEAAAACATAAEVETLLDNFYRQAAGQPLLEESFVLLDVDSGDKTEAIRDIIDAFHVAGRTDDPQAVEDAVWAREEVYTTGLGHGFAIPHCKTDAMAAPAVGVARLREPLAWGSVDGQPVRMVLLLAVRESDPQDIHLRVLAQLARRLMHEDFRAHLLAARDAAEMIDYLTRELNPGGAPSSP
ncbi:MAG TPA: phosphoenolpyruvate--protein phosphotransferase [Phycisphaerae bacterium]|nr:phosphoenolpyruvate--protein phosphotransferase [Phycisphaerae bacterium]HNU44045.1 phosphoenolpyruvate--protein phosphotransferase [Phycisphaerae bacterium]